MPDEAWLLTRGLKLVVTAFVTGTVALGAWLLARRWRNSATIVAEARTGRTVSSPRIVILAAVAGTVSLGALSVGLVDGIDPSVPNNRLWWLLVVAGFAVAALYAASVGAQRWAWNDEGIVWHGVWQSKRLSWPSISNYGQDWMGARYVAGRDGTRIRWSDDTFASHVLDEAVLLHRPDLAPRRPTH